MIVDESLRKIHPLTDGDIYKFATDNKIPLNAILMRNEKKPKGVNGFYVFNLDDKDNGGTHWTCAFFNKTQILYFDPFGLAPPVEILKFMKSYNKNVSYSSSQLQNIKSITCGYFVCYFMYRIYKGKKLYDFLYNDNFSGSNTMSNEDFIKRIFKLKK
jgi:hypothetical protein